MYTATKSRYTSSHYQLSHCQNQIRKCKVATLTKRFQWSSCLSIVQNKDVVVSYALLPAFLPNPLELTLSSTHAHLPLECVQSRCRDSPCQQTGVFCDGFAEGFKSSRHRKLISVPLCGDLHNFSHSRLTLVGFTSGCGRFDDGLHFPTREALWLACSTGNSISNFTTESV